MIILKGTNETLEITTGSTAALDISVSFVEVGASTFTPSNQNTKTTTATTTVIVASPASGLQRQIKMLTVRNNDASASNTISIKLDVGGTEYKLTGEIVLLAGEVLMCTDDGFVVISTSGVVKPATDLTANATFRLILQALASHTAARAAGTYGMGGGAAAQLSTAGSLEPLALIYLDPADFPTVGNLPSKLRLRIQIAVNDVAPTGNFTFGLYPITRPGTSGGAGLNIYTFGTVVPNSTVLFSAPAADSLQQGVSAEFTLPAAGFYAIGFVSTAAVATSSHMHMNAQLQQRNAA